MRSVRISLVVTHLLAITAMKPKPLGDAPVTSHVIIAIIAFGFLKDLIFSTLNFFIHGGLLNPVISITSLLPRLSSRHNSPTSWRQRKNSTSLIYSHSKDMFASSPAEVCRGVFHR